MASIGLIDVDGHNGFPNLALMRLSAYHKNQGDSVEWWNGFEHYDRVYMSKVFTFTPDIDVVINADEVIQGGTGYKDYGSLPDEIENTYPDYSIYPHFKQAIGFLTRGCVRNCPWCIVPRKEGKIHASATWEQVKRPDSDEIVFLDNNVLACEHGIRQMDALTRAPVKVDFNQGLDARLIDADVAELLSKVRWIRYIRLACDTHQMLPVIEKAVTHLLAAGIPKWRLWSYALVQDVDEAYERVTALRKMGVEPFAQPYRDFDGGEPSDEQKRFARWCNNKAVFRSCDWHEYSSKKRDIDGQ